MGTIPTTPNFTAGQVLTATELNNAMDVIDFWAAPPRCYLYHSSNQSISNSTITTLAWDTELYDTDAMHDTVTNNSRITIKTAGYYEFVATVAFPSNGTGFRHLKILKNGTTSVIDTAFAAFTGRDNTPVIPGLQISCAVNDYFQLQVEQNSGGALNVLSGQHNTFFRAVLIGG